MLKAYVMLNVYRHELLENLKREEGQDLIEYALLVGFIAIVAAVAVQAAGGSVSTLFQSIATNLPDGSAWGAS